MNYGNQGSGSRRLHRQNSVNMSMLPSNQIVHQQQQPQQQLPNLTHLSGAVVTSTGLPVITSPMHGMLQHQLSTGSNMSSSSSSASTSSSSAAANGLVYMPRNTQTHYAVQMPTLSPHRQQHNQVPNQVLATSHNIAPQKQQQQQQHHHQQHPQVQQQQPQAQQQQQQPQSHINKDDGPVTLLPEICDIMRSFGDSDQPRMDSVRLVENILQQQLRGMFNEASMVAMRRKNSACPSQADFEFLMRNKPVKIARMRKHLKDMRILKKFLSIRTGRPQDFVEDLERTESDEELGLEVPELYDEERTRRLFRADRISQILTGQQYLEFNEARKTSFYCRHGEKIKNKFRSFLTLPANLRIPVTTMNILAYFAHETIAVIVDYAILTRLNTTNRKTEPYSRVTSTGASAAMLHICPEVTQGRGMEVVKPITVQEIHEGIRRFRQMTTKQMGFSRNTCDYDYRRSFLAI